MDAGISVSDFVSSTTISTLKPSNSDENMEIEDKFIINPDLDEMNQSSYIGYFAYRGDGVQVAHYLKNVYDKVDENSSSDQVEDYWKTVDVSIEECKRILDIQKKAIYDKSLEQALASEDKLSE